MTALFSRGKGRRAAAAVGAVTLGLVALTACDKPTPLATVTVGSTTVSSEATDGCFGDGKALDKSVMEKCLSKKDGKTVKVGAGEKVRIGVEPKIADTGWVVVAGGPVMPEPTNNTYRTFDTDTLFTQKNQMGQATLMDKVTVTVIELNKGEAKGMWHFNLERDGS
ncbi:hypothetical protein AB0A77_25885 [Streptomyces varsoviensis]|uniref:hypothetical protein n=1 Tax=Streptomyces varsoviensis TaxID=67373 RepID=UPI0033D22647